ncbi:MAG: DUF2306 domain-containing protein [Chloroflexota bacterium]|nr:DUF2306 domain-containing protein [Chloroflexota bacterium]
MVNNNTFALGKQHPARRGQPSRRDWLVAGGLILLAVIPIIAGTVRVGQLTIGAETTPVTPENARFFAAPLPVILHVLGATVYSLLGAFQFAPGLRLRYPRWHRRAGWLLVPAGLAASLSGLWMAHFYPWPAGDGPVLYAMRLLFGFAMTLALVLAVVAVRQRQFPRHGAWMIRAYAIGMGAGTQVLTAILWALLVGTSGEFARNMIMGGGWVINVIVAEWIIRRHLTQPQRKAGLVS